MFPPPLEGLSSLSAIVTVVLSWLTRPVTGLITTEKASSGSSSASLLIGTLTFRIVSPGSNVTVVFTAP